MTARSKRILLVLAALAAALVAGGLVWHFCRGRPGVEATEKRYPPVPGIRNVVLISIDTCRADRLSCYGYPRPSTPNIDAVARDAVLFKQAMTPVPMTLPSHSSTFTGTYPPVHGVRTNDGYRLADSNVTLAKVLRNAGYETAAFIGGFPLDARFGLDQGFQTYDGRFGAEGRGHDRRTAEEVTRLGLAWLDAHDKQPGKKPFFLFLHYYDAHAPYRPPPPFDRTFADDPYAGGIAYIDSWIGRVVGRLRELGQYDNTLLIIVGDHGESLGEHGERTHAYFVYQSTLRVPLVIRAPGLAAGHEVQETVNLVDIMPTALSLLGLVQPQRVEGADLRECLEGAGRASSPSRVPRAGSPCYGCYFESLQPAKYSCCPLQGVVDGRWKYIRAPRPELYDLASDPGERENVAQKEAETAGRLRDRLEAMLEEMKTAADHDHEYMVPDMVPAGNSALVDPAATKRLESLGYVGGPVRRADFDPHAEDPKDFGPIKARIDKVNELHRTGRYEEAKKECLQIVALRPRLVLAYTLLGDIATRQNRPGKAVEWLSKALSLATQAGKKSSPKPTAVENQEIAAVHGHLGVALLMQGKTEQAGVELRAALALDADSADLHYNLGNVCTFRGQASEAVACYQKALEFDPRHVEAHYSLGTALVGCGRFDEALAHFRKALEIEPGNVRAQVSFGDALAGHGDVDEAIAHYRKALEIEPDDADANNNLGLALSGRGQGDEAIFHFRKALQIKPDYAAAHNNLALALSAQWKDRRGHRSL